MLGVGSRLTQMATMIDDALMSDEQTPQVARFGAFVLGWGRAIFAIEH